MPRLTRKSDMTGSAPGVVKEVGHCGCYLKQCSSAALSQKHMQVHWTHLHVMYICRLHDNENDGQVIVKVY